MQHITIFARVTYHHIRACNIITCSTKLVKNALTRGEAAINKAQNATYIFNQRWGLIPRPLGRFLPFKDTSLLAAG